MKLRRGLHWLTFMFGLPEGQEQRLTDAAQMGTDAGATFFELAHGLSQINAATIAKSLKAGGMNEGSICVFFAPGMGNPLGDGKELEDAHAHFEKALATQFSLSKFDITCNTITGPSCLPLGIGTKLTKVEKDARILAFYSHHKARILDQGTKIAIELLRSEEDKTFESVEHWMSVIDELNQEFDSDVFGAHYDVHHITSRGWNHGEVIRKLWHRISYLHLHGTNRIPAGATGDTMPWTQIRTALEEVCQNSEIPMCYEPFCETVRTECPPLGVGLPKAVAEPEGMKRTFATLAQQGFEFA